MKQEVRTALKVLKEETASKDCPIEILHIFQPKFLMKVEAEGQMEQISQLLRAYFIAKSVNSSIRKIPRQQLITALSLYFMRGKMDKETRQAVGETLQVTDKTVNSLNLELRDLDIMYKPDMSKTGEAYLSEELQSLRDYYYKNEGNKISILINIEDKKA